MITLKKDAHEKKTPSIQRATSHPTPRIRGQNPSCQGGEGFLRILPFKPSVCVCFCRFDVSPPKKKRQRMPWGNILRKTKKNIWNKLHPQKKQKKTTETSAKDRMFFEMHFFWRTEICLSRWQELAILAQAFQRYDGVTWHPAPSG